MPETGGRILQDNQKHMNDNRMDYFIYNTDCVPFMEKMPDKSVDLLLTDIPYGVVNRESNGLRNLNYGAADIVNFDLQKVVGQFCRISKGSIYVFCGTEQVSSIRGEMVQRGLSTRLLVWEKPNCHPMNGEFIWLSNIECCVFGKWGGAVFNGHCEKAVLRYPTEQQNRDHPTQKPLDLFKKLIHTSSSVGDTVFDPFMGSGTTGVASLILDRKFIGCELSSEWFNVAERRIQQEAIQGKLFLANEW